ncbi:nucleoside-triphosphate diphosphatase [Marinococcus halophilus]|uniref:dITP/XTP pyrophosphatase n=1 Tax=Marinococcus halophilus TaxID=1371 RepID=A0A510Y448_MARHA|nr:XTP/dITP diphosphatase [Marinococcus halophilus]OZT79995.1 nucleoside-triphosphate diphosphatase [Marinococcus halophilus]GEK58084.1 non-canonical purine NTP pyrophosphatase [Marinococcus halophilus]
MKTIVIATKNAGKVKEFEHMFGSQYKVESLLEKKIDDIPETGVTFEENAIIKAEAVRDHLNCTVIADDSGLEIDALDGRPGVYSARYAGENKDDEANMEKVLQELKHIPRDRRSARFVCVLAVALPDGSVHTFTGTCEGEIAEARAGTNGFGYDPVFYLPGYKKTMAELNAEEKHRISHRGRALEKLWAQGRKLLLDS